MQSSEVKKYLKAALFLSLILMSLLFAGCGSGKGPAKINDVSFYDSEIVSNKPSTKMYLSWTNKAKGMTVDSLELVIKGRFGEGSEGNDSIRYRISLPEGLAPGEESSSVYDVPGLLPKEKYKVYVSRVSFSDGTVWTSGKHPSGISVSVDGRKGKGMPASLEECNYYEQKSGSFFRDLNVLWINKGDKALRGVVYEIKAYDSEGKLITDSDGGVDALYFSSYDDVLTLPGEVQSAYHLSLSTGYYLLKNSAYIDVRIVKAIAEDGTVYTAGGDVLTAYFGSKKAYNFGNADNKAVKDLGNDIKKALKGYGISTAKPLIYVREGDFALLRFDDFDVRAELTEKNKISPYCVSIVGYYTREEYTSQINDEGLIEMDVSLAKGILPCVLTKMKKKDILAKLDEYYHNNEYYVDFDDHSYDTFEEYTAIFNEQGERLICSIFGVGKDFDYYPSKDLFWAYDSIYDSQRYMTVMKRPQ